MQQSRPISYRQVEHGCTRLTELVDAGALGLPHSHPEVVTVFTGEVQKCPPGCTFDQVGQDDVNTRIALAGGATSPITGAVAIDSTDFETWARPRSWDSIPDSDPDELPHDGEGVAPSKKDRRRSYGNDTWPRIGVDGRKQHTVDVDAREGWRTSKRGRAGDTFIGYDVTLAVATRRRDQHGEYVAPVITAVIVRPGGCHKGRAGIDAVDAMTRTGIHTTEVVADRGYTYCTGPTWADQLRFRGVRQTLDLHPLQRGRRPGPVPGTMWVDGNIYTTAMPENLVDLPGKPLIHDMAKLMAWADQYEPRTPWRFLPMAKGSGGRRRFKGPALSGKVRCVNTPRSMRGNGPLTRCIKSEPCGCGITVTVDDLTESRERQSLPFGSHRWVRDYSRREHVESANASLKLHHTMLVNGSIRVMGSKKVGLMIGYAAAAATLLLVRSVRARAGQTPRTYTAADDELLPPMKVERRPRQQKSGTESADPQATGPPPTLDD